MSDSNYFDVGELFLETLPRINAKAVLYGPDLTDKQIAKLEKNKVEYIQVDPEKFKNEMQFMKFEIMANQIHYDYTVGDYSGFTLADFDTFFINDWEHIFYKKDFDYGLTIRNDMVAKRCLRAYTNGGVVFAGHAAFSIIHTLQRIIKDGHSEYFPEYNRIWNTLETGRPAHKTHHRTSLRWWVDQVAHSALALRYFESYGYKSIGLQPKYFYCFNTRIALFGCDNYNVLESPPNVKRKSNVYIRHLKSTGRSIVGKNITKEKIE